MNQSKMSVSDNTVKKFEIKHVFKDVMKMRNWDTVDGPIEYHYGIPWKIRIVKCSEDFYINLDCLVTSEFEDWSIGFTVSAEMLSNVGEYRMGTKSFEIPENNTSHLLFPIQGNWRSRFIANEILTVEYSIQIEKMTGNFEKKKLIDFGESNKEFSDVVLKIGDQKFHVNKMYLSFHSTYFNSLFSENFAESQKSEIELNDIDPEHFQDFLELIYGESYVNDETVEGILHLADFFDAKTAVKKCRDFLLEKSKLPLKRKFEAAIKGNMDDVKRKCLSEMKTKEDVKSVIPQDPTSIHQSVWAELFEKIAAFK